jgi:hypothetical protein
MSIEKQELHDPMYVTVKRRADGAEYSRRWTKTYCHGENGSNNLPALVVVTTARRAVYRRVPRRGQGESPW